MSQIILDTRSALGAGTVTALAPATPQQHFEEIVAALFVLNVTAAAVGAGDTLDVYVQSSIDDGTIWDDFIHFTQVLGNGGLKKFKAAWSLYGGAPTVTMGQLQDGALAAGSVNQGPIGNTWRTKTVVAGGTAAFSYTLSVEQFDE